MKFTTNRETLLRPLQLVTGVVERRQTLPVLANLLVVVLGMALLLVVGRLLYHLHMPKMPVSLIVAFLLSAFAFFCFGYLIAAVSPTSRVAQVIGNLVFFPMLFLSGSAMPMTTLPPFLQTIGKALPMTYVVNLLQGFWIGKGWGQMGVEVAVIVGTGVVALLVAMKGFRWE